MAMPCLLMREGLCIQVKAVLSSISIWGTDMQNGKAPFICCLFIWPGITVLSSEKRVNSESVLTSL